MSTPPSSTGSYVRRNLPPLIVGVAAIVAIVGAIVVVVDRSRDDDVRVPTADTANRRGGLFADGPFARDAFEDGPFADQGLRGLLEQFLMGGAVLGVSVSEADGTLVVGHVDADSPADDAGIEVGDEIRAVNGDRVETSEQLRAAVSAIEVGDDYELEIRRDGDEHTLTVARGLGIEPAITSFLEQLAGQGFDLRGYDFGNFDLRDFGFAPSGGGGSQSQPAPDRFGRQRLGPVLGIAVVQANDGLRVVSVDPNSVAAVAGLEEGDVILEVEGVAASDVETLRDALPRTTLERGQRSSIVHVIELLVQRGDRRLTIEAKFPQGPPIQVVPGDRFDPALPNATATPERFSGQLDDLEALRSFLGSEVFIDQLGERLRGRIEALVADAMRDAAPRAEAPVDATPAPADATSVPADAPSVAATFGDLTVFRGTVTLLTDTRIILDGSRGAIGFALTAETAIVGSAPRLWAVSSVASNAAGDAVLVLTAS
ncbi:MAG: PDZ domain-containing protein [Chloroflexi bacterium]|nr:PDZ domain-containing protein [Chloroflexota bacterium]MDA1145533.1 PDZ domain-containing protein [Chloroflexota bacterium]